MSADSNIYFTVTRGKLKGKTFPVHQICNDWVTCGKVDGEYGNNGQPLSLGSCYFPELQDRVAIWEMQQRKQLGSMFTLFFDFMYFMETGRFRKRK